MTVHRLNVQDISKSDARGAACNRSGIKPQIITFKMPAGLNPSMQSSRRRPLMLFQDSPATSRAIAAAGFAGRVATRISPGSNVKLFVEGITRDDAKTFSDDLTFGFPVCPTAHSTLEKAFAVVDALAAFYRINAFIWSIQNKKGDGCMDYLKYCTAQYLTVVNAHDLNSSFPAAVSIDPKNLATFLAAEAVATVNRLKRFGIACGISLPIPNATAQIDANLRRAGDALLAKIRPEEVDGCRAAAYNEISAFYDRQGITMSVVDGGINATKLASTLDSGADAIEAANATYAASVRLFSAREIYLCYSIARETFNYGVANIGHFHVMENISGMLSPNHVIKML